MLHIFLFVCCAIIAIFILTVLTKVIHNTKSHFPNIKPAPPAFTESTIQLIRMEQEKEVEREHKKKQRTIGWG